MSVCQIFASYLTLRGTCEEVLSGVKAKLAAAPPFAAPPLTAPAAASQLFQAGVDTPAGGGTVPAIAGSLLTAGGKASPGSDSASAAASPLLKAGKEAPPGGTVRLVARSAIGIDDEDGTRCFHCRKYPLSQVRASGTVTHPGEGEARAPTPPGGFIAHLLSSAHHQGVRGGAVLSDDEVLQQVRAKKCMRSTGGKGCCREQF